MVKHLPFSKGEITEGVSLKLPIFSSVINKKISEVWLESSINLSP